MTLVEQYIKYTNICVRSKIVPMNYAQWLEKQVNNLKCAVRELIDIEFNQDRTFFDAQAERKAAFDALRKLVEEKGT